MDPVDCLRYQRSRTIGGTLMSGHGDPIPMTVHPSGPLKGTAVIPGDKSISHRSLILGALCVGETRIEGLLEGQDVLDTAKAMQAFGAEIAKDKNGVWHVWGVGTGGFGEPEQVIDCGNSGTGVRLIMGAMATTPISAMFTGDASLRSRPMGRVTDPISLFGAASYGRAGGRLPMTIVGAANPVPVNYTTPMASAQVKSAVLLAGLNAPGQTIVTEATVTRDHTERMLRGFGATVETQSTSDGRVIVLTGQPELTPQSIVVPRDPSSAAFPVCAALITEGSDVLVPNIGLNPTRAGLFQTLIDMGAELTFESEREEGGEPVADLRARYSPGMVGIDVPAERAASMIDEFPILSVVASHAKGTTNMLGVHELRVKESDRIDAMARGLEANGVAVAETEDTMSVTGNGPGSVAGGGHVAARLDHRIAMSFACLGMSAQNPVHIDDVGPIATSFPIFEDLMTSLGAHLERTS